MAHAAHIAGKVVAITGGGRGIGLATATHLHRLGARVAVGDIDETTVKQAATDADLDFYSRLDVTDPTSFATFLDDVERELGPIDVLINNAGIMPTGHVADEPDAVTRRILDINVYGVITGSRLALQRMLPRASGHIINIASLAGQSPTPGLATYCASKFAVIGFTESARLEYKRSGVAFSTVSPTFTNTELVAGTQGAKGIRNAEPEEIAKAIADLIRTREPSVAVTRLAGLIVESQKFVPRAVAEFLLDKFGMDHVFLEDVDTQARRAYEDRARGLS